MITKGKGSASPGALGQRRVQVEGSSGCKGKRQQGTWRDNTSCLPGMKDGAVRQGATNWCEPHSQGENILRTCSSSTVLDLKPGEESPSGCRHQGKQLGCCAPAAGDLAPCNLN